MNAFQNFLKKNGYTNEIIKNAKLLNVEIDKLKRKWIFIIEFSNFIDADLLFSFTKAIKDHFKYDFIDEIDVKIKHLKSDKFDEYAANYWISTISHLGRKKASYSALREIKVNFENNTFIMKVSKLGIWVKDVIPEIYEIFKDISIDAKVDCIIDETLDEAKKNHARNIIKNTIKYDDKNIISRKISGNKKPRKVIIKDIPLDDSGIQEYINNNGNALFKIEGKIVSIEIKELTTATLLEAIIEDESDAITIKSFINNQVDKDFAKSLTPLMYVELTGEARFDTFASDVVLMVEGKIELNPKPEIAIRKDLEKEKRIELHLHTKMSEMDGIDDAKEFIKRALYWGHDAIAFTDHNSLQAFPDIVKETSGKPIKPIFGVELDMVDPEKFIIVEKVENRENLLESTYVVFDIETTGLSVINDYIIEIGAVKIKNGEIIDRYQSFVNPEITLSNFIKDLTNISDDDLKDARIIENVLPEFINFIKDTILVAHNAQFDINFIRQKAFEIGFKIDNNYIDTLNLARYFYNDKLKRFNLKALSRYFKVELENHHRADVDAQATSNVWLKMLYDLREKGIKTTLDLYNAVDKNESFKYMFPTHVTLLAKNQVGYKNLFKLVSLALTKNFYQNPRILKSDILALKEGLLIGSACGKGDVFEAALNGRIEDLIKAISFYDYIEVNPPSFYFHLIEKRGLDSQYLIETTIKKIIAEAKKQKKIVVATGNVHYLEKEDLIYRKIYIRTPVVGGGIHPLYGVENLPDQYFRSTIEMLSEFNFLGEDLAKEIVVVNTHLINRKIEKIKAFPDKLYSLDDDAFNFMGISSIETETKRIVFENAEKKYGKNLHFIVKNRIEKELESIIGNKFAPIYYISHLLVKKSLNDGYLVGSRGSVGSSLVATLMNITEVNPLKPHYRCLNGDFSVFKLSDDEIFTHGISENEKKFQKNFENIKAGYDLLDAICPICGKPLIKDGHDIPFETFLGFKGDKIPDIDLNFSGEYQSHAHNYVKDLLGEEYSYRAGTVSTVADKTAYGYVLGYLEDNNEIARRAKIKILANRIKGVKRSTGQHPGGIIVVPKNKSIYDVTPIQYPANDTTSKWYTTHFDYHSFESNLLKLDILGHDDPTMIKFLMNYIKENPQEFEFHDAMDIPLDDKNVLKMFQGNEIFGFDNNDKILGEIASQGIPEFGTNFTREMLKDTKPKSFAELVKISGLSHGTDVWIKNARDLVAGTPGYEKIPFSDIIGCRDDIMVQLIDMGLEPLKAFDIMEFVRKGKPSKDLKKWSEYSNEMKKYNVPSWYISSASKIKYMFPKAHATAYVIMAIRIAWFKLYKPLLFYSAFFSKKAVQFDYDSMVYGIEDIRKKIIETEKIPVYKRKGKENDLLVTLGVSYEMLKRGFKFLPVDIEKSEATIFKIEKDGLRMPFITVDGLGEQVAYGIVEARNQKKFESISDVHMRTKINKTVQQLLKNYNAYGALSHEKDGIAEGLFAQNL